MKKNSFKIELLVLLTITLCSCKKEVELLDDYKDSPIVYGIIDAADSISYIRIQKTYLSKGDIFEDAQIPDSNVYNYKLDISIKSGNNIINFDTTTLHIKEYGTFFSPDIPVYWAVTKNLLDVNLPLELEIKNPKTGNIAKSTTHFTDATNVQFIRPVFSILLEEDFKIEFETAPDVWVYQLVVRYHYMEMLPNDSSSQEYKYIDIVSQVERSINANGGDVISFNFSIDYFFKSLIDNVSPSDEIERYIGDFEFIVNTTETPFYTYYRSVQPNNSILEHPKTYTNIENGYGLFVGKSSKSKIIRIGITSKPLFMDLEGLNFIGSIPED